MTSGSLIFAAAVAGVLALDNVQILQWLFSRPVFSGTIIGACLGDLTSGMLCGAWIELVWLGVLPIGNYTPPDAHITAVCATAAAHVWGGSAPAAVIAVMCAIPIGVVSRKIDHQLRSDLSSRMNDLLKEEPPYRISTMMPYGLSAIFLKAFLALLIAGTAAAALAPVVAAFLKIERVHAGLTYAATLIPALGMVQLSRCIGAKSRKRWVAFGACAALMLLAAVKMR